MRTPTAFTLDLGNRIRARREVAGWSLEKMSEVTGIGVSSLSQMENGTVAMRVDNLMKLCDALQADPNQLLL